MSKERLTAEGFVKAKFVLGECDDITCNPDLKAIFASAFFRNIVAVVEQYGQEVEAAIAERMPTEEVVIDIKNILDNSVIKGIEDDGTLSYGFISPSEHYVIAQNIERWFRSRMEEKPEEGYIDKSISIDEYMEKNPKLDPHEQ
jgi:hypothetical protein